MRPRLQKEIRELSLRAADGPLGEEDRARLNSLLESDNAACRLWLEYSMLDGDLAYYVRSEAAEDRAAGLTLAETTPRWTSRRGRFGPVAWGLSLALAASAAYVAVGLLINHKDVAQLHDLGAGPAQEMLAKREPQPIASLTMAPGAEFGGHTVAAGDSFLEGDQLTLTKGEAHVSMSSGADLVLKSPGSLRFVSAKHVRLEQGVMTAQVAEWGSGFTVDTNAMRVTDLGTRFAIDASSSDVETHVLQGQVRVQPLESTVDGRRSVLLSKGEALRVDRDSGDAMRMDAEADRFPTSAEQFRPFKPIAMFNTGAGIAEGDEDQHWRITGGPEGGGYHGEQFGVVAVPHERYAPNEPERSQWISVAKDLEPGVLPNSVFTLETEFDLTGFDLNTVMVAAQILADNGVRAMRINGEPVDMKPWDDNEFGQSFTRNKFRLVEIQRGFVPGVNKIEIDVWNGVYQYKAKMKDPNPMSLRVEFQAYGRLEDRAAGLAAGLLRITPLVKPAPVLAGPKT